jgi:enediyne biosynthesis protein E4
MASPFFSGRLRSRLALKSTAFRALGPGTADLLTSLPRWGDATMWFPLCRSRGQDRLLAFSLTVLAILASLVGITCNRRPPEVEPTHTDQAPEGPPCFAEVTEESNIRMTFVNGEEAGHMAILESLGGGVALFDYDGDGLLDVFIPGGGQFKDKEVVGRPAKLYRNLGNWKFRDVTREVGLDKLDCYSHGAAAADFDNDGWPDLLVSGWGGVTLYHNEPDGKGGRHFVDVTRKTGLAAESTLTDRSLVSLRAAGVPGDVLTKLNVLKDKTLDPKAFRAEAARILTRDERERFLDLVCDHAEAPGGWHWASSAAWADLDGDGFPELYVCQYGTWSFANHPIDCTYDSKNRDICPPHRFKPLQHRLFHNEPDGKGGRRFVDVSRSCCIDREGKTVGLRQDGKGLAVLMVDIDGDGKPDIYVANDTDEKFLYHNESKAGKLVLREEGVRVAAACDDRCFPNGSMGLAASDYNRTGRPSLFVTNYENELHALYRNDCKDGERNFNYSTHAAGLALLGKAHVGWGTGFLDVDLDGWEDLFIAHGHVILHPPPQAPRRQFPVLMRNVNGKFIQVQGGSYFDKPHNARGVALGDLNNRGRTDLVVSHLNEPVDVLKNIVETNNHWLGLDLVGRQNRDVVGARIVVEMEGATLTHFATAGGSYASTNDRRRLIGLGAAPEVRRVTVHWPWTDKPQVWEGLKPDRYWRLTEGQAGPDEFQFKR